MEPNKMNDMRMYEEVTLKKNDSLRNRIVEVESKINTLKSEYDQKLLSNEKFLKIYEEKRNVKIFDKIFRN